MNELKLGLLDVPPKANDDIAVDVLDKLSVAIDIRNMVTH